jgi:hypothetical protein
VDQNISVPAVWDHALDIESLASGSFTLSRMVIWWYQVICASPLAQLARLDRLQQKLSCTSSCDIPVIFLVPEKWLCGSLKEELK